MFFQKAFRHLMQPLPGALIAVRRLRYHVRHAEGGVHVGLLAGPILRRAHGNARKVRRAFHSTMLKITFTAVLRRDPRSVITVFDGPRQDTVGLCTENELCVWIVCNLRGEALANPCSVARNTSCRAALDKVTYDGC
jgi:hypothetical protein